MQNQIAAFNKLFEEQLLTDGIIKWHLHDEHLDICIMNDIKATTGHLMPQSFVHVECTKGANDQDIFIQCTCEIYNLFQRAAHQETQILPGEDIVPDENMTCMHCRFFREHLLNAYATVKSQPTTEFTRAHFMVHQSLQHMNTPVQLVGNVIPGGTTRFSSKGKEGLSIVHISFYQGNAQILCTDGHCSINFKNKKNITRRDPDHQYTHMCSHLRTMFANWDSVKGFFPDYFLQDDVGVIQDDPVNQDDINIGNQVSGKFNIQTGLWDYPALSKHKPKEMMDPEMVNATLQRNELISARKLNPSTGLYCSFICKPSHLIQMVQQSPVCVVTNMLKAVQLLKKGHSTPDWAQLRFNIMKLYVPQVSAN